jgi:hypothetical protein
MKKHEIDFQTFKDYFVSQFVFKAIERPRFNEFLQVHFKVYTIIYKNTHTVSEYAKIALDAQLNEFEIYGMQLKEGLKNKRNNSGNI